MHQEKIKKDYIARRAMLFQQMPAGSIAVLPSSTIFHRNNDAEFSFRQNSNFYYLTGFNEPDSVLVLQKDLTGKKEYILFCRHRNPEEERWVGARLGVEGALSVLHTDQAYPVSELDTLMPKLMMDKELIFYTLGENPQFDERMMKWVKDVQKKVRSGVQSPDTWKDLNALIFELRLKKSESEIGLMKEAARITALGHIAVMKATKPGIKEYQLEAEFVYQCMKEGARFMAYPPIVATGDNSLVLHYTENSAICEEGQLVLVDAGCEYENYASDVTRTFPVNGHFNLEQRAIYELVLKAQLAGINEVKPGARWNAIQDKIVAVLVPGLIELGLLKGEVKTLIQEKAYLRYYMHSSGHWLGLDVHDVGKYKEKNEWRKLEPGMVLTVEPGIYISRDDTEVDERWRGIGVRIEDDVWVTEKGHEVLTDSIPKTVVAIEALMKKK